MLSLTISVNNNRAEGTQASRVRLPLNADALKISLNLPAASAPPAHYRVELLNDRGESKFLEIAGKDAQSISVIIPAKQLVRGQYALHLFATNPDGTERRLNGSYFFTVE
jgi:hypothetical protein